jgi:hypothetical protein
VRPGACTLHGILSSLDCGPLEISAATIVLEDRVTSRVWEAKLFYFEVPESRAICIWSWSMAERIPASYLRRFRRLQWKWKIQPGTVAHEWHQSKSHPRTNGFSQPILLPSKLNAQALLQMPKSISQSRRVSHPVAIACNLHPRAVIIIANDNIVIIRIEFLSASLNVVQGLVRAIIDDIICIDGLSNRSWDVYRSNLGK